MKGTLTIQVGCRRITKTDDIGDSGLSVEEKGRVAEVIASMFNDNDKAIFVLDDSGVFHFLTPAQKAGAVASLRFK